MKLNKLFLGIATAIFSIAAFSITQANAEEIGHNEEPIIDEDIILNPEDYDPIDIPSYEYHQMNPMWVEPNNSAVMVGYFDDVQLVDAFSSIIVTDGGIFNNNYVPFDLYNSLGYTKNQLASYGVVTIGIDFRIMIQEIDDGYQHLYLYDGSSTQLAASSAIDHTYGTTPKIYEFYGEIQLSQLSSSTIYFRFDASGAWDDDWKCVSLVTNVLVSREDRAYNGIKNCGIVSSSYFTLNNFNN